MSHFDIINVVIHCENCERYELQTYSITFRSSTVLKVLFYKSEGRWFDPSWCHWNFSLT